MTSDATEDSDRGGGAAGISLREARIAQNLGVGDVAHQLKLTPAQVEALETGDFERLPGPVFVRGFARNYARLLGLDAEPVLHALAAGLPGEEPLSPAPPSQDIPFPTAPPRRWRAYAVALAVIVAALVAYEYFPTAQEPVAPESAVPTPAPPPAPVSQPDPGSASVPGTAPGSGASGPSDEPGAAAGPAPGERQVRLVFEQTAWVEIRDRSGKAIFSRLNAPGTEQRVNGRPPLAVVVGNARGVQLTYDEQPVNLAVHTRVAVARLTLQ